MEDKVLYEISMTSDVASYWYGKFNDFKIANPDTFEDLTFAQYIGEQVLNSMKILFEVTAADVPEEQS